MKIREFKARKSDLPTNEAVKRPGDDANKSTHLRKPISLLHLLSVAEFNQASGVIIKAVQEESFPKELKTLKGANENCSLNKRNKERAKKELTKTSQLYRLNPFIDKDGVLRVGGRLQYSSLDGSEKHPIVLPKGHHVSVLLIKHLHAKSLPPRSTSYAWCPPPSGILGDRSPQDGSQSNKFVCHLSETERTNVTAAHGRSSRGKNQSESTIHVCRIQRVWTLADMNTEAQRGSSQL